MTSETSAGLMPLLSSSARMTVAPSSGAGVLASVPPNLPIAVRSAPAMTMSVMRFSMEAGGSGMRGWRHGSAIERRGARSASPGRFPAPCALREVPRRLLMFRDRRTRVRRHGVRNPHPLAPAHLPKARFVSCRSREALMTFHPKATVMMLSLALAPVGAQAAELETLNAMHPTNIAVDWQTIPQTGPKADQTRQNLAKIK